MKYSDLLVDWLKQFGYSHCFYVAGGNIMHLLESCSKHFRMVSVIHEVAAGVAAEYFNQANPTAKAFALVTAGPGMTNIVTAIAGAWLESRELLVIGGQVKTADLSRGHVRQRGIQEIDGVAIAKPICCESALIETPLSRERFFELIGLNRVGRNGPVFLEIPLDVQGVPVQRDTLETGAWVGAGVVVGHLPQISKSDLDKLADMTRCAERPLLLLGGGVSRQAAAQVRSRFEAMGLPIATTWNGADRILAEHPNYVGRPNTWGQRYANLLLQQSDLLIALGTRLGMQQTGFNWKSFVPVGKVVQVDCDPAELDKGHPKVDFAICADADDVLLNLSSLNLGEHSGWLDYCRRVKAKVPLIESNNTGDGYISPYCFVEKLSEICRKDDVVIPCSSGGALTVMMQTFSQKEQQIIITNKGLASMGYGLSGAVGAAFAQPDRRTLLVEGDGGFAQNLQEIGTVAVNRLNLKIFIFDDNGYASIRMTQRNYFGGRYIGCDIRSGLGLPDWEILFAAYKVPAMRITVGFENDSEFNQLFNEEGPAAFLVSIDPEQTYFPKITSRVTENGEMESNPLHRMTPPSATRN